MKYKKFNTPASSKQLLVVVAIVVVFGLLLLSVVGLPIRPE